MIVTVPETGATIKLAATASGTVMQPCDDFDYSDPHNAGALTTLRSMVKASAIAIPGGQAEQAQATQPPEPGAGAGDGGAPGGQQLVSKQVFDQTVAQLQQQINTAMQMQAGPAPQIAGGPSAMPPAPQPAQPQAQPVKAATYRGLLD